MILPSDDDSAPSDAPAGPLAGIRVLDLSTIVAGPLGAALLADLGAEVLKVEMPGEGDHIRQLPPHKDGISLWSKVTNRNKRGVTLDLRDPRGRAVLERMLPSYDVLVENFRPGTLAAWGLDADRLRKLNPRLIVTRVTGFGQTGPYANRPGFARIFEALSGFVNLCGDPGSPPTFPGVPVADVLTGVFTAFSVCAALVQRNADPAGEGQEIDLSATEAMFRVMDFMAIEYDQLGKIRGRTGNLNAYSAPGDVYRTRDGKWVALAVSAPAVFRRLATAWQRPDLLADPRFVSNADRLSHREAIEAIAQAWFGERTLVEASSVLLAHDVSFSPIFDIRDIFNDPHFEARKAIVSVKDDQLGWVRMQGVVPRFSKTPGRVWASGPEAGQHNADVYGAEMGMSDSVLQELREKGVI
ncbi:CoA transferase [Variovorax sp. dw_954]|uniref:CaiB/BaiF CoA transferase family protein n=1 Tax=Variovorax sp. dw_954 TaxID=2720078 RepID=UPI001BD1E963|nr:CoA transferase [Variovorax sp. dw_954]